MLDPKLKASASFMLSILFPISDIFARITLRFRRLAKEAEKSEMRPRPCSTR